MPREIRERIHDATGDSPAEIFTKHLDVFRSFPLDYDDDQERLQFWRDYLRFMVAGDGRRNDPLAQFWQDSGLDPRYDFDWSEWRGAMGYRRGGRK